MADLFGYSQLFTDRPETWFADGYVGIADGYGTPSFGTVPSGIVQSITYVSTGLYTIDLKQPWYALLFATAVSEIPSSLSPAYLSCQLVSDDVGTSVTPKVTIQFHVSGTPTDLPEGSGFRFLLLLKRSSA